MYFIGYCCKSRRRQFCPCVNCLCCLSASDSSFFSQPLAKRRIRAQLPRLKLLQVPHPRRNHPFLSASPTLTRKIGIRPSLRVPTLFAVALRLRLTLLHFRAATTASVERPLLGLPIPRPIP